MQSAAHKKSLNLRYVFSSISLLLIAFLVPTSNATAETQGSPWQGSYLGVFTGFGYGNTQLSTNVGVSNSPYINNANINAVNSSGSGSNHPSTAFAGLQAGQDWAWNQMVYGMLIDYSTLSLGGTQSVTNATYPDSSNSGAYSISTTMGIDWLFTLRGRIGYATTVHTLPTLFYVTAGPALTQVTVKNNFSNPTNMLGGGGGSSSSYEVGWAAGAGVELLSFNHISVDLEYLYVHIPSASTASTISNGSGGFGTDPGSLNNPFSTTGNLKANLIRLGLNYRF